MNYFLGYNFIYFNNKFSSLLSFFNDYNYSLLMGILIYLSFSLIYLILNNLIFKSQSIDYRFLEMSVAVIPIFMILLQMIPSLGMLFLHNLINGESHLTVKVTGHQWYWEYNILDFDQLNEKSNFDSYIMNLSDLKVNNFMFDRNISVDNSLVLPVNTLVRFLVTSSDVIHSFSLQSVSMKLDAMAGILNGQSVMFMNTGLFYGFCSEICGVGHSSMPILLELTTTPSFLSYYLN